MPALEKLLLFADPEPRSGPAQMALDEALLETAEAPILRSYQWSGSWVSFGYSQSHASVRQSRPSQALVRRWTGGGIVDHDGDWTFSLVVPRQDAFASVRPADSYCAVHRAVQAALESCDHAVRLAPPAAAEAPGSCFAGQPAEHDVLDGKGSKLCGGAQRRTRTGILHQGSIRNATLPPDFLYLLASHLAGRLANFTADSDLAVRAADLERTRYGLNSWTQRIS